MKSLLFGLLLLPLVSVAQTVTIQKPVQCGETKIILGVLAKEFQEIPTLFLNSDTGDSKIGITVNHQTKSWTLLEFNTKVACILSTGQDFDVKALNDVKLRRKNSTM
jgi:hypothetical protein